jgi:hypothetical protein
MIEARWLRQVKAKPGAPIWRTDETTGSAYSFKLTAAGLKAIEATEPPSAGAEPTPTAPSVDEVEDEKKGRGPKVESREGTRGQPNIREGSKLAAAMTLLRREGGVTIDELSTAMNWLPHSTRAVLTGLRKRGILVARRKAPNERASAYVIETDAPRANEQA